MCEALFEQPVHGCCDRRVAGTLQPGIGVQYVGFEGEQPRVEDGAERAGRDRRSPHRLGDPPVDGLQPVQRGLGLGDLHLGGREPAAQRPLGQVPGEEGLAGSVLAADRLEGGPSGGDRVELVVEGGGEPVESHGEQVEPCLRDGPAPQRPDDLSAAPVGDLRDHDRTSNCSLRRPASRMTTPVAASTASTA